MNFLNHVYNDDLSITRDINTVGKTSFIQSNPQINLSIEDTSNQKNSYQNKIVALESKEKENFVNFSTLESKLLAINASAKSFLKKGYSFLAVHEASKNVTDMVSIVETMKQEIQAGGLSAKYLNIIIFRLKARFG